MSVALKKIDGVTAVNVRLNEGKALIELEPGNAVRIGQLRKTVRNQGFTPREARIEAVGDLTAGDDGHLQLKISGTADIFRLNAASPGQRPTIQAGTGLAVTGTVAVPRDDKSSEYLEILAVAKDSPPRPDRP